MVAAAGGAESYRLGREPRVGVDRLGVGAGEHDRHVAEDLVVLERGILAPSVEHGDLYEHTELQGHRPTSVPPSAFLDQR